MVLDLKKLFSQQFASLLMFAGVYEFVILWSLCGPLFDVFLPTVGLTDFHDLRNTACGYSLTVERVYIHHEYQCKIV